MSSTATCRRQFCQTLAMLCLVVTTLARPVRADDAYAQYFDQLRQRNLFSLAESYAMSRLSQPNLSRPRRIQITVELSRTLCRHATYASEQQQPELWARAKAVLDEQRAREPSSPFEIVLVAESAIVPSAETEWLRFECDVRPYDETLEERARKVAATAVEQLSTAEKLLLNPPKEATKNTTAPGPTSHELRGLLHRVRYALAESLRNRAELFPADSRDRSNSLSDAEQTARKIVGTADEPLKTRAKLLLAACARLKGDLDRADEMLAALEKTLPESDDGLAEAITAERVSVLLERHQAPAALQQIVQVLARRKVLTGELWYLRTRALVAMRDIAATRKDADLAKKLGEEAEITLQRCDEQVGGFWSRRCRQLWEARQTAEKYGPELDGVMQQARADFLANRIEAAVTGYARGERLARAVGQLELAFDLGYTRASILLRDKQFEAAAAEFLRLAKEFPESPKAPAANLNGVYSLGRLYDQLKSQSRREAYTNALDEHIQKFAADSSIDDARFFKAQLEEQRLQATVALPLYLAVDGKNPRSGEARAGAARCYETILNRMRERNLSTTEFQRTAISTLDQFMTQQGADASKWTSPEIEVAVHLAAILLAMETPAFGRAEGLLAKASQSPAPADPDQLERWKRLRLRGEALHLVALAGQGKPGEAERMIDSLATASTRDLVVIIDRLAAMMDTPDRQRQIQYVNLVLRAAEHLEKLNSKLPKEDQEHLDEALGRAYLKSGQLSKALEIYQRQANESSKDANRQRAIAQRLAAVEHRDFIVLANKCWRRTETMSKQGTSEWLSARLGVISTSIQLNEKGEARKLLGITKVLYPDLGGKELKARFEAAEKSLATSDAKP